MAKEINNTARLLKVLRSIFHCANIDYCGGSLPEVEITFSSTRGAYGHFSCGQIWKSGEDKRHEININPDYVLTRPIEETVATMLHEMAHLYASVNGIKDTSNNNVYHNKKFKEIAEGTFKLTIEHHDKYGWTITSPSEETMDFCIRHEIPEIRCGYEYGWLFGGFGSGSGSSGSGSGTPVPPVPVQKPKQSTRRYVCPACGTIIRATRLVNVVCGDCGVQFVES